MPQVRLPADALRPMRALADPDALPPMGAVIVDAAGPCPVCATPRPAWFCWSCASPPAAAPRRVLASAGGKFFHHGTRSEVDAAHGGTWPFSSLVDLVPLPVAAVARRPCRYCFG